MREQKIHGGTVALQQDERLLLPRSELSVARTAVGKLKKHCQMPLKFKTISNITMSAHYWKNFFDVFEKVLLHQTDAKSNANDFFFVYCKKKKRQKGRKKEIKLIFCRCAATSIILLKHPVLTWTDQCTCRRERAGCG